MSSSNTSPDTFSNSNDASKPSNPNKRRRSPAAEERSRTNGNASANNNAAPTAAAKRIACVICRKRKLKCDGNKPSCSTCKRLGHDCAYDEVRRKSGPKRGYVKALEERLKQVEEMLKTQDPAPKTMRIPHRNTYPLGGNSSGSGMLSTLDANFTVHSPNIIMTGNRDQEMWPGGSPAPGMADEMGFDPNLNMSMDPSFQWELIGLGLQEPLPPQETIDELHQIYFEKVHPSVPMIHKYRYLAAMNLAPNQRPPICLRYAIWTSACSVTEKYSDLKDLFYQRARKYIEMDYLKGHGEHMISVGHAQTHILLCAYEFKMMYFPRAWMSTGSAVRLCQMMGLHRLDGAGLDVKQCLPPARDWTEREERRRTFWMAFCEDRYASIGTGWPMTIDENDVLTNLPASEEAFEKSKPESTQSLAQALNPTGAAGLSAFGGVGLMAALFGRNLVHLHRPDRDDNDGDLTGEFWTRHRQMDNILLNISLNLPGHLKLPAGLNNPNIVFTNMNIHTSTICLHQAAIYKADKNRLSASVSRESKMRCINSANEIANIMRMVSHLDLCAMNPFISFCLYVAARVFVQYLKSRPDDDSTGDSLQFLLSAMNAMKVKNPLTESFLVQLDVDLEGLGFRDPKYKSLVYGYSSGQRGVKENGMFTGGTGPNGKIDQCNFLKIVDQPEVLAKENSSASGSSNPQQQQTQAFPRTATTQADDEIQSYTDVLWANGGNDFPAGLGGMNGMMMMAQAQGNPIPMNASTNQSTYGAARGFQQAMHAQHLGVGPTDMDVDISSGDANEHRTPSSSGLSDARSGSGLAPHKNGQQQQPNGPSSYETSPVVGQQNGTTNVNGMQNSIAVGQVSSTFYSTTSSAGQYMSANGVAVSGFGMQSHGRQHQHQPNQQHNFATMESGNAFMDVQQEGLTPIGEGVFRELMGIGGGGFSGVWDGQG